MTRDGMSAGVDGDGRSRDDLDVTLDPLEGEPADSNRRRLVAATIESLGEDMTLSEISLDAVAGRAGMSRATVYRAFPGGRAELLRTAVGAEVAVFWRGLAAALAEETTLSGRLIHGLMDGTRRLREHALLQRLVVQEAADLARLLDQVDGEMFQLIRAYLADLLDRFADQVDESVDRDEAAGYLAMMLVSFLGSPGRHDLTDEAAVTELVRTQLLGGILRRSGSD